jgi:hypothetical protein
VSDNHNTQLDLYQDPQTCQDVKTGDSARPVATKERAVAVGGARDAGSHGARTVSPHLSNFDAFAQGVKADYGTLAFEAAQRAGKKALLIDRDVVRVLPPPCNTGATITLGENWYEYTKRRKSVDWLRFTLPVTGADDMIGCVAQWTDRLGGMLEVCGGRWGYVAGRRTADGAFIYYHPDQPDMKVCVDLSATALQTHYVRTGDAGAIESLIVDALGQNAAFTRFDAALDTTEVAFEAIVAADTDGQLVTPAKSVSLLVNRRGAGGTLSIGRRESRRYVRIYDKAAEQKLDGQTWVRIEVELKAEYAHRAVTAVIGDGVDLMSLIVGAVDFREVTADTNVSRRPRLSWWAALVEDAERLTMTVTDKVAQTLDRTKEWLRKQVFPALAFVTLAEFGSTDWLYDAIAAGRSRLKPVQVALLYAIGAGLPGSIAVDVSLQDVTGMVQSLFSFAESDRVLALRGVANA